MKQIVQQIKNGWIYAFSYNNIEKQYIDVIGILIIFLVIAICLLIFSFIRLTFNFEILRAVFIFSIPLPIYLYMLGGYDD